MTIDERLKVDHLEETCVISKYVSIVITLVIIIMLTLDFFCVFREIQESVLTVYIILSIFLVSRVASYAICKIALRKLYFKV